MCEKNYKVIGSSKRSLNKGQVKKILFNKRRYQETFIEK